MSWEKPDLRHASFKPAPLLSALALPVSVVVDQMFVLDFYAKWTLKKEGQHMSKKIKTVLVINRRGPGDT
jgi:hypothetical protein